jgi:hypothetical protein
MWLKAYLAPLVGRTIRSVSVGSDGFPVLTLSDGQEVLVSRDEEGNGPGFLFGLPQVFLDENGRPRGPGAGVASTSKSSAVADLFP